MRWSMVFVLAALLAAAPQGMAQERVVADISFPFIAVGKVHAPGQWTLVRLDIAGNHGLQIRNLETGDATITAGMDAYRPATGKMEARLTFNRYGNQYFLSEVWAGGTAGTYLPPCNRPLK